ncbi:MAG: DUF1570 domain-containing protein [Isosphaeraceae bacterium]
MLGAAGFGLLSFSFADLLYFERGGEVHSPAVSEGDRLVIELPDRIYSFHISDFRKRVPGFDPAGEVAGRFRQARAAGQPARHAAVWWAIENGQIEPAAEELRKLHEEEPRHAPTSRMIAALDALSRPCTDPDLGPFRKALRVPMDATRGPHIVLLHQRDAREAEHRVALLERVITGYYLFFAAQGIELTPPARRLVVAWFNEKDDYLTFLRTQDAAVFSTTRGYFHPTWNAVVGYDARSTERQETGHQATAARRDELRRFRETVERMPPRSRLRVALTGEPSRTLGKNQALELAVRLDREIDREELLLDLERRAIDEGTAAHEMIHLLAANSGLLPRHDAFPRWLQEGLAMQFELIRGGRWAGIGRAHDLRLPDWRRIQPPPPLEPLVRDRDFNRGYQRDAYAQAWSLVYYLRDRHPAKFLTFLDLLRSPDTSLAELPASDRSLSAFRRAFGDDLVGLEHNWNTFMSSMRTPLEQNAPPASPGGSPAPPDPGLARPAPRRSPQLR